MEEFTDHPNNGHMLVHAFMLDLPEAALRKGTNPVLLRQPGEHHLCVMCLKAIMESDYGWFAWRFGWMRQFSSALGGTPCAFPAC